MVTPKEGYIVDPSNPNGVIKASDASLVNKNANYFNQNNATPATPTTPVTTPTTPAAVSTEYYSRVGNEPAPVVAETADQIQERKIAASRAMMDNLNKFYDSEVASQTVVNEGRSRGNNAISALTGLSGSTEAEVTADKTNVANKREVDAINQQRAVAIQGILTKIADSSVEEARQSRLEARQSAQDIQAFRLKAQTDAVDNLTKLSKTTPGLTLDGLKATLPPEQYASLIKNAGGEALAKATIFESRPKNDLIGTPQIIGDYAVQMIKKPDGSVSYDSVLLSPEILSKRDNIKSIEKTDSGLFIINKDGTWSTIKGSGAIKTAPKQTETEQKSDILSQYTQAFTPGVKIGDVPTISPDGKATFDAWKEAIKEAPTKGVSRDQFIKNFGNLLLVQNGKIPDEYGLTPIEKRLVLGAETATSKQDQEIEDLLKNLPQ